MPLMTEPKRGSFVIFITFFLALALSIVPLPWLIINFVPEWTAMVLIYWCLAIPHRVGMIIALIVGLVLDGLKGHLFGQHALGLVVIAYLVLSFYQRIRISPVFQQALTVLGLLFVYQLLLFWFDGISRAPQDHLVTPIPRNTSALLLPPVGGFIVWPWLFYLMRAVRRRYKIR